MAEIYKSFLSYNISKHCVKSTSDKSHKSNLINFGEIHLNPRIHEFLSDNHKRKKYEKIDPPKSIVHYGQLKLFLTNLQFLTKYWDPIKNPRPKLVYVGAAPCSWGVLFAELFPMFELHLYDPEEFDITLQEYDLNDSSRNVEENINRAKIYLYKRCFTNDDVSTWQNVLDVFFVSDIRPFTYDKTSEECERVVHDCMTMQSNWIKEINPDYAQVKFKLPYNKNFGEDDSTIYQYLGGRIYFQQWVGPFSTETRLVSSSPHNDISYDYRIYEEMMFHHNTVERNPNVSQYINVFTGNKKNPYTKLLHFGLYNDLDSTMTIQIIKEYLEKVRENNEPITEDDVADFFDKLNVTLELAASRQRQAKGIKGKLKTIAERRSD